MPSARGVMNLFLALGAMRATRPAKKDHGPTPRQSFFTFRQASGKRPGTKTPCQLIIFKTYVFQNSRRTHFRTLAGQLPDSCRTLTGMREGTSRAYTKTFPTYLLDRSNTDLCARFSPRDA